MSAPHASRASRIAASLLLAALATACGPFEPTQKVLKERARWKVTVLGVVQGGDGTVIVDTRLSGPPNAKLQALTVRVQLADAGGGVVDTVWHTFDLSGIRRGGPADVSVRLREYPQEISGAGIDRVLAPSPEEAAHIAELQL